MTGRQARILDPELRWNALVTFVELDGRLRVADVEIHGGALDVSTWRSFPLARIETRANEARTRQLLDHYADMHMRSREVLEDVPASAEKMTLVVKRPPRPPYPDSVYLTLANNYRWCVLVGLPPAQSIADANGVPVRTVYGWFREARRRGILEPGRKGRAG
jgi:hypothetical protein